MIRQVFSQAVFLPRFGGEPEPEVIDAGLQASRTVLRALDEMCREGLILCGMRPPLADRHLAPMTSYFSRAEDGHAALIEHDALFGWWQGVSGLHSLVSTDPWPDPKNSINQRIVT
jgi:glutathione S-transferase